MPDPQPSPDPLDEDTPSPAGCHAVPGGPSIRVEADESHPDDQRWQIGAVAFLALRLAPIIAVVTGRRVPDLRIIITRHRMPWPFRFPVVISGPPAVILIRPATAAALGSGRPGRAVRLITAAMLRVTRGRDASWLRVARDEREVYRVMQWVTAQAQQPADPEG